MTTEELLTLYRTALVDKICGEMYENRQPYNKGAVADREAVPISKKFTPKEAGLIVADCNERYGQTRGEETVYHYEFYYRWDGHLFIISEYVSGKKGEKMGFKSDGI